MILRYLAYISDMCLGNIKKLNNWQLKWCVSRSRSKIKIKQHFYELVQSLLNIKINFKIIWLRIKQQSITLWKSIICYGTCKWVVSKLSLLKLNIYCWYLVFEILRFWNFNIIAIYLIFTTITISYCLYY